MIGRLLGHTKVETKARYAHLAKHSLRETAVRIFESIAGGLANPTCFASTPSPSRDLLSPLLGLRRVSSRPRSVPSVGEKGHRAYHSGVSLAIHAAGTSQTRPQGSRY